MSKPEKTEEEKLRSKRIHAVVMMILGAIMAVCALAAGLIALSPGAFPSWMAGVWGSRRLESHRTPAKRLVTFAEFGPAVLSKAWTENKLVLLHLAPWWSRDARLQEETVYADPKTAAWIAENLLPAHADADERPDLAYLYGVGAWPATVLVRPDGKAVGAAARLTPKLFKPWAELIAGKLKADPGKAPGLADDARRRFEAVRARSEPPAGPDDAVWGGVFRSPEDRAKILADQAAVVLAGDPVRAKAALYFVENFMSLPGGGYAASMRGEVELADGRVEEGYSYYAKDDAGRRAAGAPLSDRRVFAGPNADMARAVLKSLYSTPAQKAHARRTLDFVWTRLVKDGRVSRVAGGINDWPADQWAVVEAELAAGRLDRARKVFARLDTPELRAFGPNPYADTIRARLSGGKKTP